MGGSNERIEGYRRVSEHEFQRPKVVSALARRHCYCSSTRDLWSDRSSFRVFRTERELCNRCELRSDCARRSTVSVRTSRRSLPQVGSRAGRPAPLIFLQLGPSLFSLILFVGVFLLIAPVMALPQIYLARSLRPLLADAPRTEKRMRLAEQLPKIAVAVSGQVLVLGLIGASGMIVCGGLALLASYLEGDLTNSVVFTSSLLITAGALLILYFTYLRRLTQKTNGTRLGSSIPLGHVAARIERSGRYVISILPL
jgi:hypothetical protein